MNFFKNLKLFFDIFWLKLKIFEQPLLDARYTAPLVITLTAPQLWAENFENFEKNPKNQGNANSNAW